MDSNGRALAPDPENLITTLACHEQFGNPLRATMVGRVEPGRAGAVVGAGRTVARGRRTGRNSVLATTTYFEGRKAFAAGVAYEDCPLEDELGRVAWQRGWLEAQRETESDERI